MLKRILTGAMAGCFFLAALPAAAAEPSPRYNTVELQAEAQREVQNDLLNASLYVANRYSAPPPRPLMARMAASAQAVTVPNLEAGVSLVTVTANGAIEILE